MKLSKEQKQFLLSRHNILLDQVMDATSMRRSEWMALIKDSEYEAAPLKKWRIYKGFHHFWMC
jgi:hypothetical protein